MRVFSSPRDQWSTVIFFFFSKLGVATHRPRQLFWAMGCGRSPSSNKSGDYLGFFFTKNEKNKQYGSLMWKISERHLSRAIDLGIIPWDKFELCRGIVKNVEKKLYRLSHVWLNLFLKRSHWIFEIWGKRDTRRVLTLPWLLFFGTLLKLWNFLAPKWVR